MNSSEAFAALLSSPTDIGKILYPVGCILELTVATTSTLSDIDLN